MKAPLDFRSFGDRLYLISNDRAIVSTDGADWQALPLTANGGGLVLPDPSSSSRFLAGGPVLQVSGDGGKIWRSPIQAPPGQGPFLPLAISAAEPAVWFVLQQGRIDRTRDNGVSWRVLSGLPTLSADAILVAGAAKGQFFVGSDSQVFELIDNGQQVQNRGQVPGGSPITALVQGTAGSPGSLVARTGAGAVFTLREGGWVESRPPVSGAIGGSAGHFVLAADGGSDLEVPGTVGLTTDGGVTWITATGLPKDQSVTAVAAGLDGQAAYAYCAAGDIYRSQDGGLTWALLSSALRST